MLEKLACSSYLHLENETIGSLGDTVVRVLVSQDLPHVDLPPCQADSMVS